MPYKIDRFNFSDQTIDNFNKVGITPDQVKNWIDDGRANGIKDERIVDFIKDQYNELNAPNVRGRNIAGGFRYAVSNLPLIGDWVDEIEAGVRSAVGSKSYDEYLKNAHESQEGAKQAFKENTANGNWFDRNIGKYAPTGIRMAGDAGLAVATGGATLMPGVSGLQGAIEGYGSGTGTANRAVNAGVRGAVGWAVPAVMNKIFPTKSVAEKTIDKMAKDSLVGNKKPIGNVIAKSMKTGKEPVSVIAEESTRATEPAIMKGLQQALKGNDAQAKVLYDSAVRNVDYDGGFVQYIKDRMPKGLSEKISSRLSRAFSALENTFEEASGNTGDLLVKENLPELIDGVINTAMRGASAAERSAVKNAATKAFADRHVAKAITTKLIPQKMIGQLGNQISSISPQRIFTRPVGNIVNAGTLNTMRGGMQVANPTVQRVLNALRPADYGRGIIDSTIENVINQ